jgi:hypothetical protein
MKCKTWSSRNEQDDHSNAQQENNVELSIAMQDMMKLVKKIMPMHNSAMQDMIKQKWTRGSWNG